ncbi:MAG: hypothetical protein AB7I79_23835 [Rhizobiaceae bacterium]
MKSGIEDGFFAGDAFVPWGMEVGAVAALAGEPVRRDDFARSLQPSYPTGTAFGLPAIVASLQGPADDRPVTMVDYELVSAGSPDENERRWMPVLTVEFGPPAEAGRADLADRPVPSSGVTRWASWRFGDVMVGLSIYGADRWVGKKRSGGMAWLRWSDAVAGAPYVPAWRIRVEALADAATDIERFESFRIGATAYPAFRVLTGEGEDGGGRAAQLALYAPDVLFTPAGIASRLRADSLALWTSRRAPVWCLSTRHDSIAFPVGQQVDVRLTEAKPAKGGGYTVIAAGRWWVQGGYPSTELRAAADALATMTGVGVTRVEEYDC